MTVDEIFEQATLNWRDNKGIGTAFVPAPLNDKVLVYQVLARVYARSPNTTTVIIVEEFKIRQEIIEFLTHTDDDENNAEYKRLLDEKLIRIFTADFIRTGGWHSSSDLCIWYRPAVFAWASANYALRCKFKLIVINKLFTNAEDSAALYKLAPLLDCFKQAELDELRTSTPVREMWISTEIPEDSESWKLYQYYTKYIDTSISIFGSFDKIKEARTGNPVLNISAAQLCDEIARENGWNERLDMSLPYNVQLDELYNPNALRDRATQTYEVIRNRQILISDYESKLETVLRLVKENPGDKILIISKRGEFANKVTDYLNNNSDTDICGNYHNKVENIDAIDENGNPIYIKSGKEKGKRKVMGAKAQMTLNEKRFNNGTLRCLSLANSPDKTLNVDATMVIITSPLCEDIKSYMYRLADVYFPLNEIKLFSIFCKNTIEQQRLRNKTIAETHIIVNKDEFCAEIENKSGFIIVD